MDSVAQALISDLQRRDLPTLAALWQACLTGGCTIYLLGDRMYHLRDSYALHWVSRYLPPEADTELVVVPSGRVPRPSTKRNIIILGRLRLFGSEAWISELLPQDLYRGRHLWFLDNEMLLHLGSGQSWRRDKQPAADEAGAPHASDAGAVAASGEASQGEGQEAQRHFDFGVLRLWQRVDNGGLILNCSGLGFMGTLATALALTDVRSPAMRQADAKLAELGGLTRPQVEILVEASWNGRLQFVNPCEDEVRVEIVQGFHSGAAPHLPLVQFRQGANGATPRYEVWAVDPDQRVEKLVSDSLIEVAILAAIAQHTEQTPLTFEDPSGYIAYEAIERSALAKKIWHKLSQGESRTVVSRLRSRLKSQEWQARFPNLLLTSRSGRGTPGRPNTLHRLRGRVEWWTH